MEDIENVLIDNLKETLKSAQTYLLTGTIAALFLLLLGIKEDSISRTRKMLECRWSV